jgi:hydroxymethylglutaryl-CoA lyase
MKIIECPRDAMQGRTEFIPTELKITYLNKLLKVGFDTIDFGSFVSPKAIPQLKDTAEVLAGLALTPKSSKLLAIIANARGADEALTHEEIAYLGYPMSISDTFQRKNTGKSIIESLEVLTYIQEQCIKANRALVVYLSMGFGNPYGDPFDNQIVLQFADILSSLGVKIISLADTVGLATPDQITTLYGELVRTDSTIEYGLHLHSNPTLAKQKVDAAIAAGCQRLDGAILGYGGCPMAEDELVGNIDTRTIISSLQDQSIDPHLDITSFVEAEQFAAQIFNP